jgi:hypothetical protein
VNHPQYPREEILRRGRELYERKIRPQVEPEHEGEFLAVNIETGAWMLGEDGLTASKRLLARESEAVVCLLRVGYATAYKIGGHVAAPR